MKRQIEIELRGMSCWAVQEIQCTDNSIAPQGVMAFDTVHDAEEYVKKSIAKLVTYFGEDKVTISGNYPIQIIEVCPNNIKDKFKVIYYISNLYLQ